MCDEVFYTFLKIKIVVRKRETCLSLFFQYSKVRLYALVCAPIYHTVLIASKILGILINNTLESLHI